MAPPSYEESLHMWSNESLFDNIYCCPKSLNSIFRSLLYPTSLNFQISNKSIEKRRCYSRSMNEERKIYYINWICCNKIKRQFFLKIFFKQLCLRNAVKRLIALWQAVPILLKSTRKSSWRWKVEDVQKLTFPALVSLNLLNLAKALISNWNAPTNLTIQTTDPTSTVIPCQFEYWNTQKSILGLRCLQI